MRPRKSCKEKILSNFAFTRTNKPVKENFSRKTCSSYRRESELVKKLVKENLLVCTGLKGRSFDSRRDQVYFLSRMPDVGIHTTYNIAVAAFCITQTQLVCFDDCLAIIITIT